MSGIIDNRAYNIQHTAYVVCSGGMQRTVAVREGACSTNYILHVTACTCMSCTCLCRTRCREKSKRGKGGKKEKKKLIPIWRLVRFQLLGGGVSGGS